MVKFLKNDTFGKLFSKICFNPRHAVVVEIDGKKDIKCFRFLVNNGVM